VLNENYSISIYIYIHITHRMLTYKMIYDNYTYTKNFPYDNISHPGMNATQLQKVRKCMHSIILLLCVPVFDLCPLWMAGEFPTQSLLPAETHVDLHVKCQLLLSDFNQNWNVPQLTSPHGITTRKYNINIFIVMRTSDLIYSVRWWDN
jgi:hypothetical protein